MIPTTLDSRFNGFSQTTDKQFLLVPIQPIPKKIKLRSQIPEVQTQQKHQCLYITNTYLQILFSHLRNFLSKHKYIYIQYIYIIIHMYIETQLQ